MHAEGNENQPKNPHNFNKNSIEQKKLVADFSYVYFVR